MEAFALTCTTCKSRLKVRDLAAIGQIMACPKCGGMVLVKPSEAAAPAASDTGETRPDLSNPLRPLPPVNSATFAIKSDAFDDVDELLGNVPPRNMVPSPTARTATPSTTAGPANSVIKSPDGKKSSDSQAKTLSQNDISVPPVAPKSTAPKSTAPAAVPNAKPNPQPQRAAVTPLVPVVVPVAPALLDQAAIAPEVIPATEAVTGSPWQYWAMVSASGVLGIVLAIGVVAISIAWFSAPPKPIALLPPVVPAVETPLTQPPPGVPATITPATNNNVPANIPPVQRIELPPTPAPPVPMPVTKPPEPMPAERDPLGLTEPPPVEKPLVAANDPLSKFDNILGGGPADPAPAPAAPKPVLPPLEEDPGPPTTVVALPKPQARHIEAAARLADPLPAIEISGSPLADFLQVMQDLSTVPITLRPDGLAMIKLTPFTPETQVTWKGSATTVGDAIQGALQPLGLEAKIEADQLVIDVASPQLTTMRLSVKDLTLGDEQRASELAAVLQSFVAPESWGDEETQPAITASKDELVVRQHRGALAECVLLIEKLRIARGLRPAGRFDPKLFELTTRSEKAKTLLANPITLNYSQSTPLLRITDRLGKVAGVRILIDWQSLDAAGWNPAAEATLSVEKQPLSTALTDLTRRMELAWRAVDARTVQILSPQTLADRTELEVYPVSDLAKDNAAGTLLVAKIRTTLGGQSFRDAGGRGELRFDATGKCLLASLSQPQQQQLAVLLSSLRKQLPDTK